MIPALPASLQPLTEVDRDGRCVTCGSVLPEGKTDYCDRRCKNRGRRWRYEYGQYLKGRYVPRRGGGYRKFDS